MKKKAIITLLGGGTGQSNILRGLKKFNAEINSVVTMADDGGNSGYLRKEYDILPPGDLRNCILALSNIEPDMERLFQYRFDKGVLKGQNFGNLFLLAMNDIHGDLKKALSQTSKILAVRGNVFPVTYEKINLVAELKNGNKVFGETNIRKESIFQSSPIKNISIDPLNAKASHDVLDIIEKSDILIAGPGSLYTSILPILIMKDIQFAIRNSNAIKIFITNIMSEHGETDNFNCRNFPQEINKYCNHNIFDYYLINTAYPPKEIAEKYYNKHQNKINFDDKDSDYFLSNNIKYLLGDLLQIKEDLIFHDNEITSHFIKQIFEKKFNTSIYQEL